MPKHALSFKHLVSTSWSSFAAPQPSSRDREKTVNELLAKSRANYIRHGLANRSSINEGDARSLSVAAGGRGGGSRDVPPHVQGRPWVPDQVGIGAAGGLELEDDRVHPAQLLRQAALSARIAARNTAGPAPPPSWRSARTRASPPPNYRLLKSSTTEGPITRAHLIQGSSLFTRSSLLNSIERPSQGVHRLVNLCVHVLLAHLEDTTEWEYEENDGEVGRVEVGSLIRAQAVFLDTNLRAAILSASAMEPEGSLLKLSDRCIKLLVTTHPPLPRYDDLEPLTGPELLETTMQYDHKTSASSSSNDWETETSITLGFTHLSLTLHSSPHLLLRDLTNSITSLSSLDLSYSTIPLDFERLVSVLPSGLRELSLAGVRVNTSKGKNGSAVEFGEKDWDRGLAAMGRRLIVLQMLDLSFFPVTFTVSTLSALLHPPSQRLPSLRLLGLRENPLDFSDDDVAENPQLQKVSHVDSTNETMNPPPPRSEGRKELLLIIRWDRSRWVDVRWD